MNVVVEESIIISYVERKDALEVSNYDQLYNETLKNCTNLTEEGISNNYRIVVSLNYPARLDDLIEDVLSFCKRYDFLKDCTRISAKDNPVYTTYDDIASINFYLKRVNDSYHM